MAPFGKVFFSLLLSPPLPGVPPFPLFSLLPFSPYSPHAISVPTLNSLSFSLVPHSHLFLNIVSIRVVVTHCCLCRRVQSLSSTPLSPIWFSSLCTTADPGTVDNHPLITPSVPFLFLWVT
ncbi:hypothetical protein I3760_01G105200 [Carya illinoinensis]|nr:hypothetical protein I3760_01G105200 [Carya illinoinensis]KAG2726281.1 hypothetical protein I3760_01G105200 [Carya illinoinensis]KAG2726282.1 hypothetical protein I3760_01G105200 [Carya illinoinensis]